MVQSSVEIRELTAFVATYDDSGQTDFQDVFQLSIENFEKLTAIAGQCACS